jgi:hypothetical protein
MGKRGFIAGLLLGGAVVALARRFGKSAKAPEALPKAGDQEPPQGFSITFGDLSAPVIKGAILAGMGRSQ